MKKMILIVMGIVVGLIVGAFGLIVYLFNGGTEMTGAQWDVWRRGYQADRDLEIGNGALRLKLPRGFRPDKFKFLPDFPAPAKGQPFPHAIGDTSIEFHARLGAYTPINRKEWSALAIVELAAPGTTSLPPLEKGWHEGDRIGWVAEKAGRRVRFSASPDVYNAEQCQRIADAALQSLRPDEAAIAAMFEGRRSRLAAQPANRKAAWDFLENRGFRADTAQIPMKNAQGDVMFLHEGREEALFWYKLAEIPAADFEALREDTARTKELILQPNVSNGLILTRRQDSGELKRYKLTTAVSPVEEPVYGANERVTSLLTEVTREGFAVLWRTGSVYDFADRGAETLEIWFADSDRLRKAQPAGWRREGK